VFPYGKYGFLGKVEISFLSFFLSDTEINDVFRL
jgi:hypothetical protein